MTYLKELTTKISNNIEVGRLNAALRLIRNYVIKECVSGRHANKRFGLIDLDRLCAVISSKLNHSLQNSEKHIEQSACGRPSTILLASKITLTGGHSKCLFDLANELKLTQSVTVVTTEFCGPSDAHAIKNFDSEGGLRWVKIPPNSPTNKVINIKKIIKEAAPDYVWLFNNHEDSVAVSSINLNSSYKTIFFHHADDRLCLGLFLESSKHVDIFPSTVSRCAKNDLSSHYLPVAYFNKPNLNHLPNMNGPMVSVTIAKSNKLAVNYRYPYYKVIPLLLKNGLQKHIHIGNLNFLSRLLIFWALLLNRAGNNRFVYIKSSENYLELLNTFNVQFCIMSFPFGAGRTTVELMSRGIPVVMHRQSCNPDVGGADLMYSEYLYWENPEHLVKIISNLTPSILEKHSRLSIKHVDENFSHYLYRASLKNVIDSKASVHNKKFSTSKKSNQVSDEICRLSFRESVIYFLKVIRSDLSLFR